MFTQHVLFLANAQLTAYRIRSGVVDKEATFFADEAGLAACELYVRQRRRSQFRLLVEGADESYQVEDIPHTSGADRRVILQRKLAQHGYATPYLCVHSCGRLKTGRRDERLLLMSFAQPQLLEPWIAVLRHCGVVLAGIYSLPQTLIGLLPDKAVETALLTTLSSAGLRQTFFFQGQMRFSRLTPLVRFDADSYARAATEEAGKMHQYLSGQRLMDRDKPLAVRLLAHPTALTALREHCRDTAQLRFTSIDLVDEARRVGLRSPLAESRADVLSCHILAKKPPREQFAPPQLLDYYRLRQARVAVRAVAASSVCAAVAFGALRFLENAHMEEGSRQAHEQARLNETLYNAKLQSLPALPISLDALRAVTEYYAAAQLRAQGPRPLLNLLSHSLDAFPAVTIERIEWAMVDPLPSSSVTAGQTPTPPEARTLHTPYAQVIVQARLPLTLAGDPRGQASLVTEFLDHLGRAGAAQASLLQAPTDRLSSHPLNSRDADALLAAPSFSFRLAGTH